MSLYRNSLTLVESRNTDKIPFSPPDISDLEINEVVDALKSGWITTGPKTKLFEKKIAAYCGTSVAACFSSATSAMELTLRILGVGPGDEVITSAYTYTASASVIYHVGAKIVLIDTAPDSYEMDYEKLSMAITEKTKVIIPVDIGGVLCNYERIFEILEGKKHLFCPSTPLQRLFNRPIILADAAHSLGACHHGKKSGSFADFTAFSFHAVKNLTTAEGGAVTWVDKDGLDNEQLYQQFMLYSLHGQSKDALSKLIPGAWEYDIVYPAYKCNLTDILSAIGIKQMERFESLLSSRQQIIQFYDNLLKPLGIETLNHFGVNFSSSGHLYMIRVPFANEAKRNDIIIKMAEKGVATNVHFKPLPMFTAYKNLGFNIASYPNSYERYASEITLPLYSTLTNNSAERVIDALLSSVD